MAVDPEVDHRTTRRHLLSLDHDLLQEEGLLSLLQLLLFQQHREDVGSRVFRIGQSRELTFDRLPDSFCVLTRFLTVDGLPWLLYPIRLDYFTRF